MNEGKGDNFTSFFNHPPRYYSSGLCSLPCSFQFYNVASLISWTHGYNLMLFLQIDIRGHVYVSQATISSTLEYLSPKAISWRLRDIKINTILKKKWKLSSTNEWATGRILRSMPPKALFSMFLVSKLIPWREGLAFHGLGRGRECGGRPLEITMPVDWTTLQKALLLICFVELL